MANDDKTPDTKRIIKLLCNILSPVSPSPLDPNILSAQCSKTKIKSHPPLTEIP
jgi:hypothetical protein